MKKTSITLITALSIFAATNASAFNLITNGGFEANGGSLDGWSYNNQVQLAQAGTFANLQGMDNNYALLGFGTTSQNSRLAQEFNISGLDEITVSFDWAFNFYDVGNGNDTFLSFLREDGGVADRITLERLRTNGTSFFDPDFGLEHGTYSETIDISSFTAADADVIFRLREASGWQTGSLAGIDNVFISAVNPVPEPSTIAMFGSAFLMLGFVGYRSRNR
jgi:hypothetical protein